MTSILDHQSPKLYKVYSFQNRGQLAVSSTHPLAPLLGPHVGAPHEEPLDPDFGLHLWRCIPSFEKVII